MSEKEQKYYPETTASTNFPELETEILQFWEHDGTFRKSVDQLTAGRDKLAEESSEFKVQSSGDADSLQAKNYIFYDGPPFANGLPHYGHLLTSCVKDIFARYHTMQGEKTERRFGWDCHGLPAEMAAEKELGVSGRKAIETFGVDKFNDHCRESVMKYTHEWQDYVTRAGRWVDFENDYKTMDTDYMESVIWAFSELYKKGLVYESFRVMPYSWAAETPLSNFETRMDDSYREREDKAVTVAFELNEKPAGAPQAEKYYLLAWTTTPWTLPSNLALAIHPEMEYVAIESSYNSPLMGESDSGIESGGGDVYILAKSALENYTKELGLPTTGIKNSDSPTRGELIKGSSLLKLTYKSLFPYFQYLAAAGSENVPEDAIFETERLYARAWKVEDFDLLYDLYHSDGVKEVYPNIQTRECVEKNLQGYIDHQKKFGFSKWAIFDKATGEFVGRGGANQLDFFLNNGDESIERGVSFYKKYWGQGFATELTTAITKYMFENFATVDEIVTCISADNVRSHKLQEKIGMHFVEDVTQEYMGVTFERKKYGMDRDTFFNKTLPNYEEKHQHQPAFCVLDGSSFIEEGSGTGIVHLAPGFGEDDMRVCQEQGIDAVVCPVDESGRYTDEIFDLPQSNSPLMWESDSGTESGGSETLGTNLPPTGSLRSPTPPQGGSYSLSLKGLNVIAQTEGQCEGEPYSQKQLEKSGLVNLRIINWLKLTGKLIKQEEYKHSYPHCWRTDTPIIYKAMSSWYVEVTKFKDRMVELNQNINWIPGHIKDGQFGKWLENARDWSISRNRFWGCPIPVWRTESGKVKVFGSIKELNEFFDVELDDLHKPIIDSLTKEENGETWTRVSDVFDCWFESGSMPYAQVHYPFENKDWFEQHFPADFIVEYVGQTRGWFYTLMVLGTALFDSHPFKNCICHGIILAEDGKKLSKKLKNYPDPNEMFDAYGADAMRWRMIKEPIMQGGNLQVSKDGSCIRDVVRLSIKPIWNAYHFFSLYANADGVKAYNLLELAEADAEDAATGGACCDGAHAAGEHPIAESLMDRYILAKLKAATNQIENALDGYDTPAACRAVDGFFDVLNNWYIRRSRDRFWRSKDASDADKQAAYDTLYTCLITMSTAAAPLLPMTMEAVYKGLSTKNSVHLEQFPNVSAISADVELVEDMDKVQSACNAALAVRDAENIRIRQPLASLTLYGDGVSRIRKTSEFAELIKDEVNVKDVVFNDDLESVASLKIQLNFKELGKKLGKKMGQIGGLAKQGKFTENGDGTIVIGDEVLQPGEFEIKLESTIEKGAQALSSNDAIVVLDTEISNELRDEGLARDVVRMIQQARKEADLNITDRIEISFEAAQNVQSAIVANEGYVKEQVLANAINFNAPKGKKHIIEQQLEGEPIKFGFDAAA